MQKEDARAGSIALRLGLIVLVILAVGIVAGCPGPLPRPPVWSEDFTSFDSAAYHWDSSGCSSVDDEDGILVLTEEVGWCRARFFLKQPHLIDESTVEFDFRMGRSSTSGGDGFTFAFVRSSDYGTPGSNGVPNSGKWLDFEGASGYAVEFDTYHNSESDPGPENHVAVIQDSVTTHLAYAGVDDIEDNAWHHAQIAFSNGYVGVYVDGALVLTHTIPDFQVFQGYFGFTAATGATVNRHEIDNIQLWKEYRPGPQGPIYPGVRVRTTVVDLRVRQSPGLGGKELGKMYKGNSGLVKSGPVTCSDGLVWWEIDYDIGVSGWSAQATAGGTTSLEPLPDTPLPPVRFAEWGSGAVSWARARIEGPDDEPAWYGAGYGWCAKFVANAFMNTDAWGYQDGASAGGNADDLFQELDRWDQGSGGWARAPVGSLIFFGRTSTNGHGHVAICVGRDTIIHARGRVAEQSLSEFLGNAGSVGYEGIGPYIGWAYPPDRWRPEATPLADSLVAYYDFDEAMMTTLLDNSQYGNHGDIKQHVDIVTGKIGNAFSFDGVDDWVEVPDSESLRSIEHLTVSCWVKPHSYPPDMIQDWTGIVAYGAENQGMWEIFITHEGAIHFLLNYRAAGETRVTSNRYLGLYTWHHVVCTFDGEIARVYVDDQLSGEAACSGLLYPGAGSYMAIGLDFPDGDEYFHGLIDDLRIYNEANVP
jgi:hypothetical protein